MHKKKYVLAAPVHEMLRIYAIECHLLYLIHWMPKRERDFPISSDRGEIKSGPFHSYHELCNAVSSSSFIEFILSSIFFTLFLSFYFNFFCTLKLHSICRKWKVFYVKADGFIVFVHPWIDIAMALHREPIVTIPLHHEIMTITDELHASSIKSVWNN